MDAKQREFLTSRLETAYAHQPLFRSVVKRLLEIGGEMVVPPLLGETRCQELMDRGRSFDRHRVSVVAEGEPNACHANTAYLWLVEAVENKDAKPVVEIATGYALTAGDGLWRQHTWAVRGKRLIETVSRRSRYYGYVLADLEPIRFAVSNLLPADAETESYLARYIEENNVIERLRELQTSSESTK